MQHELQPGAQLPKADWVCPFCYAKGCPDPKTCHSLAVRNQTLEEVAVAFEKMTAFGDTAASCAVFVRQMKR